MICPPKPEVGFAGGKNHFPVRLLLREFGTTNDAPMSPESFRDLFLLRFGGMVLEIAEPRTPPPVALDVHGFSIRAGNLAVVARPDNHFPTLPRLRETMFPQLAQSIQPPHSYGTVNCHPFALVFRASRRGKDAMPVGNASFLDFQPPHHPAPVPHNVIFREVV